MARADFMCCSYCPWSSLPVTIFRHLSITVHTTAPILFWSGWCDVKCHELISVWTFSVHFNFTVLSDFLMIMVSRDRSWPCWSGSWMNLMDHVVLDVGVKLPISPLLAICSITSMYHFHNFGSVSSGAMVSIANMTSLAGICAEVTTKLRPVSDYLRFIITDFIFRKFTGPPFNRVPLRSGSANAISLHFMPPPEDCHSPPVPKK